MAVVGTCVSSFDQYRNLNVVITGFVLTTGTNTTPSFRSIGFAIGSWAITGTWTGSIQLMGSNDGTNFFALGTAQTINGVWSLTNPTDLVPVYYQFGLATQTAGTGTANINVTLMSTFG